MKLSAQKKEIVIAVSDLGSKLFIGDILHLNIDNEDVKMIVVFPMLTVSKCRLLDKNSSFLSKIPIKSPVYLKPFKKAETKNSKTEIPEEKTPEIIPSSDIKQLKGEWKEYWVPDGNSNVT